MSEEGSGILSGDAVERRSECLLQCLDGACGDPAQVGFHLGPAWLECIVKLPLYVRFL
jgi:hypothetical protein